MKFARVYDTTKQTDTKFTSSLAMPEKWAKTKKKKDGKVQGFTFRGEGGFLYLRLGAPEPVEGVESTWRYTFELSHTMHMNEYSRNNASINDRVFFAQGGICLMTDDPKPVNFQSRVASLIEEYNIALLRIGRIFEVPEESLKKKDSPTGYAKGGYTLLGIKMDVNPRVPRPGGNAWDTDPNPAQVNAEADWTLRIRYMIRSTHDGFDGAQQIGGRDAWGNRGANGSYVEESRLGPEVLEDTAGEVLVNAVDAMLESTVAHFEMLRGLARTAADDTADTKTRVEAAEELDALLAMKSYSYGREHDYHYIATPREPVESVMAAVKSLITVMPDIVE